MPTPKGFKHTEETKKKMREIGKLNARSGKNKSCFKKGQCLGEKNHSWNGGESVGYQGYYLIYKPNHPSCKNRKRGKYVKRCRLMMEEYLGRFLKSCEIVHHINENRLDDRLENFILFRHLSYHLWFHKKGDTYSKGIIFDGRKLIQ